MKNVKKLVLMVLVAIVAFGCSNAGLVNKASVNNDGRFVPKSVIYDGDKVFIDGEEFENLSASRNSATEVIWDGAADKKVSVSYPVYIKLTTLRSYDVYLSISGGYYFNIINALNGKMLIETEPGEDNYISYVTAIEFADGVIWNKSAYWGRIATADFTAKYTYTGTTAADTYQDGARRLDYNFSTILSNGLIDGGAGNDTLYGNDGNDILLGGAGADKLYGVNGNNFIDGGIGNDDLYGSANDDAYVFRGSFGYDYITEIGGTDVVIFADINRSAATITKSSSDLMITVTTANKVKVIGFFSDISKQVESIRFKDGVVVGIEALRSLDPNYNGGSSSSSSTSSSSSSSSSANNGSTVATAIALNTGVVFNGSTSTNGQSVWFKIPTTANVNFVMNGTDNYTTSSLTAKSKIYAYRSNGTTAINFNGGSYVYTDDTTTERTFKALDSFTYIKIVTSTKGTYTMKIN